MPTTQGGGGSETGPEGVCCSIQTSGWRAPGSGSSGMWSNLGGGWQAYCTRTDTAVHHQGWKGSYWFSSSLCNLTRAPSDAQGRSRRPQPCLPSGQVSACARLLGEPHHLPLADGRPPASAHPSQKLHKFKQGREGGEKKKKENKSGSFQSGAK